jgi:hypothetical protein
LVQPHPIKQNLLLLLLLLLLPTHTHLQEAVEDVSAAGHKAGHKASSALNSAGSSIKHAADKVRHWRVEKLCLLLYLPAGPVSSTAIAHTMCSTCHH